MLKEQKQYFVAQVYFIYRRKSPGITVVISARNTNHVIINGWIFTKPGSGKVTVVIVIENNFENKTQVLIHSI